MSEAPAAAAPAAAAPAPNASASPAPAAGAAAAAMPALGSAAITTGTWRDSLPEDIRSAPSLAKFNDQADVVKSYLSLEQRLGSSVPLLKPDATDKEKSEFYTKLGRPDKIEGYEFKALENAPPGLNYSPERDKAFAETVYNLGLTKAQATNLREALVQMQVADAQQAAARTAEATKKEEADLVKLQATYGPKWDATFQGANLVLGNFGGEEMVKLITERGLQSNPTVIKFLANVAGVLQDHSVITGTDRLPGNFGGGPASALAEIEKMKGDPETQKALIDTGHKDHATVTKRWKAAFDAAYPKKK